MCIGCRGELGVSGMAEITAVVGLVRGIMRTAVMVNDGH